jgi:hypothetical protein
LHSLERIYEIEGVKQLPVLLHLVRPALVDAVEVGKRWSVRKETKTIVIYRLPILRLNQSSNPTEERVRIEHHVFEAAAALIGKEPWELIFGDDEN